VASKVGEEAISLEASVAQMRQSSPAFIPRNHIVESVLRAGTERQDFQPFEELLDVLAHPYDERPGRERYSWPARPEEYIGKTFCGT
jgi:uncharacterized protein YdiU (UPF0061 family)